MPEALEHPWLAEPSSQTSDSQPNRLCGDSVWSIEFFDPAYAESAPETDDGRWSRPMTVSGTNFESEGHVPSDGSFSQPMGALQLDTPANRLGLQTPFDTPSLPSPPLADDQSEGAGITSKRKPEENVGFSSGSLSPPPTNGILRPQQAAVESRRRESLRNAGRPRKSMRIA